MTATQWAEFAGLGFAMAVLAWVIYRLTWAIINLVAPKKEGGSNERAASGGDSDTGTGLAG